MSRGLWLWEAPYLVFDEVWRLREAQALTDWWYRVVCLNKTNTLGLGAWEAQPLTKLGDRVVRLDKQTLWGREPGGSEVGSLDVWRSLDVWMFGCLKLWFVVG